MNDGQNHGMLAKARVWLKDAMLVATAITGAWATFVAAMSSDVVRAWVKSTFNLREATGGVCAIIPRSGHVIVGAPPGGQGYVKWRDVTRTREDCGIPELTGQIVNGGSFYHDAALSTSGVALPVGTNDVGYSFIVPVAAKPGPARFRVSVTFPDAVDGSPPTLSPWLDFVIAQPWQEPPSPR